MMEKLINLANRAAQFAEENPEMVRIALNVGVVLTAVGALTFGISQAARTAAGLARVANTIMSGVTAAAAATQALGQAVQVAQASTGAAAAQSLGAAAGRVGPGGVALSTGGLAVGGLAISTAALAAFTAAVVGAGLAALALIGHLRGDDQPIKGALEDARDGLVLGMTLLASLFIDFEQKLAVLFAKVVGIFEIMFVAMRGLVGQLPEQAQRQLGLAGVGLTQAEVDTRIAEIDARVTARLGRIEQRGQELQEALFFGREGRRKIAGAEGGAKDFPVAITDQMVKSFIDFQQQTVRMQDDFQRQRAQRLDDFHQQTREMEADYYRNRARAIDDFERGRERALLLHNRNLDRMAKDFQERQAQITADFQEDDQEQQREQAEREQELRNEFALKRERALEDHIERVTDAAGRLDAVGVLNELRRFEKTERRAKEDFERQAVQRAKENAKRRDQERKSLQDRLNDAKEAYEKQREAAIENFEFQDQLAREDFARRLNRMDEEHALRMTRRAQQFNQELQRMDDEHRFRMLLRQAQFADELKERMRENIMTETEMARHYANMAVIVGNFISNTLGEAQVRAGKRSTDTTFPILRRATGPTPIKGGVKTKIPGLVFRSLQEGGRVRDNMLALVHRDEEVLSERIASGMRSAMGGNINQDTLLQLARAASGFNVAQSFHGMEGPEDVASAVRNTMQEIFEGFLR
jgi:hypothetical protein